MTRLFFEMTMSLDGFITDPNTAVEDPGQLHQWMFGAKTDADAAFIDEKYASVGAIIIGRRMFDLGVEPWGDPPPFGMPVFILTNRPQPPLERQGGTTYTFVSDGLEAALERAGAAAGDGGIRLFEPFDTAPLALEPRGCVQTPGATHLRFGVVR